MISSRSTLEKETIPHKGDGVEAMDVEPEERHEWKEVSKM